IPAELIGEAFKLKKHTLRKVAGALVLSLPCPNRCGNSVKNEFRSRLELKNYHGRVRGRHRRYHLSYLACDECQRKAEAERETEEAAKRRRNLELQGLPWESFTETEEWRRIRNQQIHFADYSCERCHNSGVGLFLYLAKDTPQN